MDVEFQHISKIFGSVKALTDVNLTAYSGCIHGLIGENGAGKSTLMKILTGYQTKSSGIILIEGQDVKLSTPKQASAYGIGMLYQEPMDFTSLTVLENFSLGNLDQNHRELRSALKNLSNRFGFHLDPDRRVELLTVGERQQIELLRLIHNKTRILILDEPTTGISPAQKEALFPALKQLAADGMNILLVSHKLEEVAALCNEVTVLRHGRVTHHAKAPFHFPELLTAMFGSVPDRKTKEAVRKKGRQVLALHKIKAAGERQGLDQCNTTVAEGEVIGLAGLDGAGQSTFLRLAAGLTIPEKGYVQLFDNKLTRSTQASRTAQKLKTSFIPADRLEEALFADISLSDHFNLKNKKSSFWQSKEKAKSLAEKAISTFFIKGQPDDTAEDLSGGNQQRLLLALLDPESRLLLLENPTRGLDIRSGQWVWQYLKQELSPKTTILFSSPELDEILHYSDRVLVFHDGKIVMDKAVNNTSHDAIAAAMTGMTEVIQ
jgi:simple sugar transport system ATP-binding protein